MNWRFGWELDPCRQVLSSKGKWACATGPDRATECKIVLTLVWGIKFGVFNRPRRESVRILSFRSKENKAGIESGIGRSDPNDIQKGHTVLVRLISTVHEKYIEKYDENNKSIILKWSLRTTNSALDPLLTSLSLLQRIVYRKGVQCSCSPCPG